VELRVGCSGWFYWHWKGRFYPEEKATHQWFAHYRRRFNTVELNAPFYRWPKSSNVRQWRRQATRNFRYCVKVNRYITHERRFEGTKTMVSEFYRIAETLGPHMGCFLFQCPPSFHYTAGRLRAIIKQLEPQNRSVVEFRHRSWWNRDVFDAFEDHGLIFCAVSGPRLPDEMIKTAPDIYVRFHGTQRWYRHEYTRAELSRWAERIADSQAERAWIFFNNDFGAYAPRNARQLRLLLKRCTTCAAID
jgi:uncharacterized protein YecE (DUF72 family)